ncbi:MAG: TonB family protein, partial [Deltaproteobacteria bacterium]|nr:TonB family protein [Deltaproteobacteria bacterium]
LPTGEGRAPPSPVPDTPGEGQRSRREPAPSAVEPADEASSPRPGQRHARRRGADAGTPVWYKFERSDAPDDPDAVVSATSPYIGDRNVVVDVSTRAPTTTIRSHADGKSLDEALPVPEDMEADSKAEMATRTPERESPSPTSGASQQAGERPRPAVPPAPSPITDKPAVRLAIEADYVPAPAPSPPAAEKRRRKARPAPTPAEAAVAADADAPGDVATVDTLAESAPLHAVLAPGATATPGERLDDDFWVAPLRGTGAGESGEGGDVEDSPAAVAGDDVAKVIYKRDGAAWIDLSVAEEQAERGDRNQVNVTRTAVGTWFVPVDDLIRATWTWPEADKALGVRGRVVVEFTIGVDGRVSDVALVDANVTLSMQEAALESIPAAVAPPPEGEGPLRVRYVFRYGD